MRFEQASTSHNGHVVATFQQAREGLDPEEHLGAWGYRRSRWADVWYDPDGPGYAVVMRGFPADGECTVLSCSDLGTLARVKELMAGAGLVGL